MTLHVRSTCKITGELLYNDDFLIERTVEVISMSGHWSDSEDTLRRYKDIDYTLEVQRPIAFLIATNRKFNLEAFCGTLSILSVEVDYSSNG